jgi:outer membrane protein assembly factor BamB
VLLMRSTGGAVYADGKIVYNLLDGHTVAVDAASGREIWNVKVGDLSTARRCRWRRWW